MMGVEQEKSGEALGGGFECQAKEAGIVNGKWLCKFMTMLDWWEGRARSYSPLFL